MSDTPKAVDLAALREVATTLIEAIARADTLSYLDGDVADEAEKSVRAAADRLIVACDPQTILALLSLAERGAEPERKHYSICPANPVNARCVCARYDAAPSSPTGGTTE